MRGIVPPKFRLFLKLLYASGLWLSFGMLVIVLIVFDICLRTQNPLLIVTLPTHTHTPLDKQFFKPPIWLSVWRLFFGRHEKVWHIKILTFYLLFQQNLMSIVLIIVVFAYGYFQVIRDRLKHIKFRDLITTGQEVSSLVVSFPSNVAKHKKWKEVVNLLCLKAMAPCKDTTQQLSFEWSHFRISSTDSKVRTTLYGIINSTTGQYYSVALIWMVS